ncbi:hypothetical protein [Massilia rubra]|uniref:ABC transporter permease n=1 Tax=Massilia rubra TaxID=2607910 RepID=A0ABX0LK40_9BURK|nr:hypothetical protein [Massilia rubra]NHZ35231.1 hypothetical protein [Massilia rubra]
MSALRIDDAGAEWRASGAIAMAAIRGRTSLGGNGLSWLFLAAMLVTPLVAGALSGQWRRSIGLGAGIPLALLSLLWWGLLLASMAQQNHVASKLVPDLARRSVRLLALVYLSVASVLTGLFVLAGAPLIPTLVIVCTVMSYFALMVVFPLLGYLVCATLFLPGVVSWLVPGLPEQVLSVDLLSAVGALFCVVVGYALPRRLLRSPWPLRAPALAGRAPVGRAGGAYARALRRDCARGAAGPLLLHALGPALRLERGWLIGAVCVSAIGVVAGALGWSKGKTFVLPMPALMAAALLLQAAVPHALVWAFRRTRAQQSLLRLAPRAPGAAAMNAVLARALLGRLAGCWAIISVLTLALAFGIGASLAEVARLLPACCLGIGASALALRNYAGDAGARNGVLGACTLWLLPAAALQYAALSGRFDNATWCMIGAVTLLAGAAWARHCWLRMVTAPPAFPAGRLA